MILKEVLILFVIFMPNFSNFYLVNANDVFEVEVNNFLSIKIGQKDFINTAYLDYYTSELIVYDSNCGKNVYPKCPYFCKDPEFLKIYCDPLCKELELLEATLSCPLNLQKNIYKKYDLFSPFTSYNSKESGTFKYEYEYVDWISSGKQFYGQFGRETVKFLQDKNSNETLVAENIRFVRGYRLDYKYFYKTNITLGLSYSSSNFFYQLYQKNLIAEPIVTFHKNNDNTIYLTLGGLKHRYCQNWTQIPTVDNYWRFVGKFYISNFEYSNVKVSIDPNIKGVLLPYSVRKHLLKIGHLVYDNSVYKDYYLLSRAFVWHFGIRLDKVNIINSDTNMFYKTWYNSTYYVSKFIYPNKEDRYADDGILVLGSDITKKYCYSFNYESKKIGLADRFD